MTDRPHFRSSSRPRAAVAVVIFRQPGVAESVQKITAFTNNIGTGGLFASTHQSLTEGERVEVELPTPSTWAPLRFNAEVVRVQRDDDGQPRGVGLRFVNVTDEQAVVLAEFIQSLDFDA